MGDSHTHHQNKTIRTTKTKKEIHTHIKCGSTTVDGHFLLSESTGLTGRGPNAGATGWLAMGLKPGFPGPLYLQCRQHWVIRHALWPRTAVSNDITYSFNWGTIVLFVTASIVRMQFLLWLLSPWRPELIRGLNQLWRGWRSYTHCCEIPGLGCSYRNPGSE